MGSTIHCSSSDIIILPRWSFLWTQINQTHIKNSPLVLLLLCLSLMILFPLFALFGNKNNVLCKTTQFNIKWSVAVLGINYIFIILDGYIPSRRRVRRLAESSAESRTGAACRSCTTPQSASDLPLPYSLGWRARVEAPRRPAGALLSWVTRTLQQIKLINFPGFVMCFQCCLLVKSKEKEGQTTRIRDIYLSSGLMLLLEEYQRGNTFIGILKAFGCNLCPWLSLL